MDPFDVCSCYTVHRVDNILARNNCSRQRNAFHSLECRSSFADDVLRRDTAGQDPESLFQGRQRNLITSLHVWDETALKFCAVFSQTYRFDENLANANYFITSISGAKDIDVCDNVLPHVLRMFIAMTFGVSFLIF